MAATPLLVRDWMVRDPLTISPRATMAEAKAALEAHRIRHLPIVDAGHLVGMLSDRDVLLASMPRPRREANHPDALLQLVRVEQVMTREPVTVAPDAPIEEAARLMLDRRFGALPVVEGEKLVGIISQGDLLKALVQLLQGTGVR